MKATGVCHEEHCICEGCNGQIKKGSKIAFLDYNPDAVYHINCFKGDKKQKHGGEQRFDKWSRFDLMNSEVKEDRPNKRY